MELLSTISLLALALVLVVPKIYGACRILIWRPFMLSKRFKKQGISGPKYRILYGNLREIRKMKKEAKLSVLDPNSNDIVPRVLPHLHQWMSQYGDILGETFLYWQGTEPRLCISDHELAKLILSNKFGFFVKSKTKPDVLKLAGNGLVFINGLDWVRHRRILNPAFSMDKIKIMTQLMVDCTLRMFEEWKKQRNGGESEQVVMINREFKRLTADIIATAAFGSSYAEGIEVFNSQRELQKCCAASITDVYIPGAQYLPTPLNLQLWKLDRKVNNSIKRIIDTRLKSKSKNYGNDLLGIMLTAARSNESEKKMSIDEIIDECKTFFFAGHETTANLLTWSTMLLSLHQDWQEKLREEVLNECSKDKIPDSETCSKLKLMNMVFMESLRLYGPVLNVLRLASEDIKLGNLKIPKGTTIILPIVKMHRDNAVWGSDADKFNPMRFENGNSRAANHPNALLAFSIGPRACIGQNFAIMEAKTVLAMILQRFRLTLSGDYKHAPADHLTLQPQYDLPVMLQPING